MKTVEFYKVEIKYSGKFEDYDEKDLIKMAKAKFDNQVGDYFDHEENLEDAEADLLDSTAIVVNEYPANKLAVVTFRWIREEADDEE